MPTVSKTVAQAAVDRDYRTACILNRHRGQKDEFTALCAVLCLAHDWTYHDSRDYDDLVDVLAIAERIDEMRKGWAEDARAHLRKRAREKAGEHLRRHGERPARAFSFDTLAEHGLDRIAADLRLTTNDLEIFRASRLAGQAAYRIGGAYLATLNV